MDKLKILFLYLKNCIKKNRWESIEENNLVLVFYLGAIGDAVFMLDFLKAVICYFSSFGKKVCLCGFHRTVLFVKEYGKLDFDDYISMDCNFNSFSYKDYKKMCSIFNEKRYEQIICLQRDVLIQSVVLAARFKSLVVFGNDTDRKKGILYKIYMKISKGISVEYSNFISWMERKAFMASAIGIQGYQPSLPQIELYNSNKYRSEREYICVCPTAQTKDRCIKPELTISVIIYLLRHWLFDVYLVGTVKDKELIDGIKRQLYETEENVQERLQDFTGATDFKEFMEILGNSKLIISCDSGPAHLGPALRIPTIVLSGYWDEDTVFPYLYNENECQYSFCIKSEKKYKCKGCFIKNKRGYGNKKCKELVKRGESVLCLQDIGARKIFLLLEELLSS